MKRNIIIGLTIGLLIFAISSCGLNDTSMADRVGYFEDDLNGTRANIIDNIHPDAPSYNTLDDTFWATISVWPTANQPFAITNISEGSSSVSASFHYGSTDTTISFDMKDDGSFFGGEDWKIWSCTVGGIPQF